MSDAKEKARSNPLIKQIHVAVIQGYLKEWFTVEEVRAWMEKFNIRKGDGTPYKNSYVPTLLSDSLIKHKKTKNRNSKWLVRRLKKDDIFEYRFADTE